MKLIERSRSLSSSASSRLGRRSMSASSSTISPASRARKSPEIVMVSRSARLVSVPPEASTASANPAASRSPAPFSSRDASRFASPPCSGGSATAPPRRTAVTETIGTSGCWLNSSTVPLSSSKRWNGGSVTPAASALSARAASRSTARRMRAPDRITPLPPVPPQPAHAASRSWHCCDARRSRRPPSALHR